jgi:signal transduction histidine kinase
MAILRVPMEDAQGLLLVAKTGLGAFASELPLCYPIGTSVASLAYELGQPIVANDYAAHPRALSVDAAAGLKSLAVFPIQVGGTVIGIVSLGCAEKDHFTAERVQLFSNSASEIGLLVENARLQGEAERRLAELYTSHRRLDLLSRRLLAVQEWERRDIARELHDEIGQLLTGLSFTLATIEHVPVTAPGGAIHRANALVDDLIVRVWHLSADLHPPMLDDLGLLPTLLWHIARYTAQISVQVQVKHHGLSRRKLPLAVEIAACRIVQEALTNIARHAWVQQAAVHLFANHNTLTVQIEDRGRGFDRHAVSATANGHSGMRERALLLGRQLTSETAPGAGTRVIAKWPLRRRVGGKRHKHNHLTRRRS